MTMLRYALTACAAACLAGGVAAAQPASQPAPEAAPATAPEQQMPPPPPDAIMVTPETAFAGPPPGVNASVTVDANGVRHYHITNGRVPDTPENRAKYGQPLSNGGKHTKPAGN